ncbi:MAG: dihydrofolate reductase [Saprospiraceae bacterium]|nr:dihydrofolate reductase [Saprospiraceae bacterium]
MIISAIVAVGKNRIIGRDNQIPWYLPADLGYFKRMTLNHHIIMGRNSFQSIGRPLPKRTNVVVSRDPFFIATGCIRAFSIPEALKIAKQNGETEAFIIGGGEIYKQSQDLWTRLYLTEVDIEIPENTPDTEGVDVFFPDIDFSNWTLVSEEKHEKDEKNECDYTFKVFEKKA